MSRLDRHVSSVQNKLALRRFVDGLAWTALIAGAAVFIAIFVWRALGQDSLPAVRWWLIGAGVCVLGVAIYALTRRPTAHDAAVAIDEKLNLHEKFSTALYVRPSKDVFAQAAVRDAERTADNVQLQRQFPIAFPKVGYGALATFLAALLLATLMQPWEHTASASSSSKPNAEKAQSQAKQAIEKALAVAETAPKYITDDAKLKTEIKSLTDLLKNKKFDDPAHAQHKAQEVLQDVQQALAEEAEKTQRTAMEQKKVFSPNFGDPKEYKSETGKKVDEDLAKGNFKKAADDVGKMAEKFDKMSEEEKKKTAEDIQKLAEKLKDAANDPKVQQEMEKKLQQMGASQQQAQQMAKQMQQAAQGDKQAQQQLQQQAQQMQQQLQQQMQQLQQQAKQGNQQAQQQLAQAQQQMQQIQQAMKQAQAQANAQAQAQQMSQAAQQMAQSMQQQQQQQAQASKQGQGQQSPQSAQQQQQMAQAQQQMQQAAQAMQAAQADADAVRASQQQAMKANGDGDGPNGKGGNGGEGEGGKQSQPGNQQKGEFKPGEAQDKGDGSGNAGISMGGANRDKAPTGFDIKVEHDIGAEREDGKILASTLIKDNQPIKGTSKLGLAQVTESTQKQATDDVDEDHVSGEARKAAEGYFRTMHDDAAPPTPAPR